MPFSKLFQLHYNVDFFNLTQKTKVLKWLVNKKMEESNMGMNDLLLTWIRIGQWNIHLTIPDSELKIHSQESYFVFLHLLSASAWENECLTSLAKINQETLWMHKKKICSMK